MSTVRMVKDLTRAVRRGHPWLYREALKVPQPPPADGSVVGLANQAGEMLGRGLFDGRSPLALRILTQNPKVPVDAAWFDARVSAAAARRFPLLAELQTDAVRMLHGEGDGLPGLVVDHYADTSVVQLDGPACAAFYRQFLSRLGGLFRAVGFPVKTVWLRPVRGEQGDGVLLEGAMPSGPVTFREGQAVFRADVVSGHKTGFFLDQRANRRLVGEHSAGSRVLDLFCYTGGFAVAAAAGGATRVTAVDAAAPAIAAARDNLMRNGVPSAAAELVHADVFDFLGRAKESGRTWDVVVCDPPSFAPRHSAKARALVAYRRLQEASLAVLAPGGLLATASCSSHVTEAELVAQVALAAGDRRLRIVARRGAGPDHPTLTGFPEGRYLAFLLLAAE